MTVTLTRDDPLDATGDVTYRVSVDSRWIRCASLVGLLARGQRQRRPVEQPGPPQPPGGG